MTRAPKALILLPVLLAAGPALAQPPDKAVHAVLLLEDHPDLRQLYAQLRIPVLRRDDRIAIMTFRKSAKVRSEFTNDRRALERVVQQIGLSRHVSFLVRKAKSPVRVFQAVQNSCGMFAKLPASQGVRRVVIVVFGSDDYSSKPGVAEIRGALEQVHASLFAAPAHRERYRPPPVPTTPPTFPGSRPGQIEVLPPPDVSTRVLVQVGALVKEHPDLAAILDRVTR